MCLLHLFFNKVILWNAHAIKQSTTLIELVLELKSDEHVILCFSLTPTAIDYREPKRFGYHAA